jgi:hypothetical protein
MGRIFTFGCSFTEYKWPTWADIILYGNEGYNCGVSGGGFDSILYRLMETDRKFKLTTEDKIIIVFTTPLRWDLIINGQWSTHGQVTNIPHFMTYQDKLFSIDGLIYKSFYNIQLIDDFLKYRNLNYVFGSLNGIYSHIGNYFEYHDISEETKGLIKYVSDRVNVELMDFKTFIMGQGELWTVTKKYKNDNSEYHPRPLTHYKWVTEILMKHMEIDLKLSENEIMEIETHIEKLEYVEDSKKIKDVFPKFFNKRLLYSIYLPQSEENKTLPKLI